MNGAAIRNRGGGKRHPVLLHRLAHEGDIAGIGGDLAGILHQAAAACGAASFTNQLHRDFVAAGGGTVIAGGAVAGAEIKTVTGCEFGLPDRRADRTAIDDLFAHHQHEAAAGRDACRGVGVDDGAGLHDDVVAGAGKAWRGARIRAVNPGRQKIAVELGGGCNQRADIDLRGAAENDAALVDQINLSAGLDRSQNLTGNAGRGDLVQGHPVAVALLVEIHRGVAADIKAVPAQQSLGGGLVDRDRGSARNIALHRGLRAGPVDWFGNAWGGQPAIRLQAVGCQPVRHRARRG